ncbi:hypothetical protein SAMN05421676_11219 [Salinibacillus kushneri]|uniref:Uncharacterized protein n=1 Tax=Salinibacillus kushneri TaxID=237682 RepID=A0A1I0IF54_9BACI|nr:hypothetical protein [Salinibacillus kushneri]SET94877.1 hypothetical protein SAMN05421676_11219 [Salinibacillus kushneri]
MKILIKHIDIAYQDITTFDDSEPELTPVDVDIHYEMYKGQNTMPGKMTLAFSEYESMNHYELVHHVQQELQQHLQAFEHDKQ